MATPYKYTHEEIMRKYGFTGLRVAQWETPSAYTFDQTSRQFRLRQAPQTYRYVIPRENVPEPTDDEASEEDNDDDDDDGDDDEIIAIVDSDQSDNKTHDLSKVPGLDDLDALLSSAGPSAQPGIPVADEVDALLAGILKKPSVPLANDATVPVVVIDLDQDKPPEKPKSKAKSKARSAWFKPSTKSKSKTAKATETKPEEVAASVATDVPPQAPEPPQILDDMAAQVSLNKVPITTADVAMCDGVIIVGDQLESSVDPAVHDETAALEPGDDLNDVLFIDEADMGATSVADVHKQSVLEQITEDDLIVVVEDSMGDASEEVVVVPPTSDTEPPDPLVDILASLDDILPPPAHDLAQADANENLAIQATPTEPVPDPLADLLAELAIQPPETFEPVMVHEWSARSIDEPEIDDVIADDASAVTSLGSEDKHVSFAPGTPEPKPTKRKKKPAKDKTKRRPSVSKVSVVQSEAEVPETATSTAMQAEASQEITETALVDDEPTIVVGTVPEDKQTVDKGKATSKKGVIRPRALSKSAGIFAAGGLLGFATMSKSSKSSKSKDKHKKKKSTAKVADELPESAIDAQNTVGLGIVSPADNIETDKSVEDAACTAAALPFQDEMTCPEATVDPRAVTAVLDSAVADETIVATMNLSDHDPVAPNRLEEAQEASWQPELSSDISDEQDEAARDSEQEPESTSLMEAVHRYDVAHVAREDDIDGAVEVDESDLPAELVTSETLPVAAEESVNEDIGEMTVSTEQTAQPDATASSTDDVGTQCDDDIETEIHEKVSRHDSGFEEAATGTSQDEQDAEEVLEKDELQASPHIQDAHIALVEMMSTTNTTIEDGDQELLVDVPSEDCATDMTASDRLEDWVQDGAKGDCQIQPLDKQPTFDDTIEASDLLHIDHKAGDPSEHAQSPVLPGISVHPVQDGDERSLVDDVIPSMPIKLHHIPVETTEAGMPEETVIDTIELDLHASQLEDLEASHEQVLCGDELNDTFDEQVELLVTECLTDHPTSNAGVARVVEQGEDTFCVFDTATIAQATEYRLHDDFIPEHAEELDNLVHQTSGIAGEPKAASADQVPTSDIAVELNEAAAPESLALHTPLEETRRSGDETDLSTDASASAGIIKVNQGEAFLTEIVEPAEVMAEPASANSRAASLEHFVAEVVVPASTAVGVEAPPSPTQSRSSRRHRSERSDRPWTSRTKNDEIGSKGTESSTHVGRSQRSSQRHDDAVGDRRRRAARSEDMRRLAHDERRRAEDEQHRRIRREARHAARRAQEAEEIARLAREQAEDMARRDAELRRQRREQRSNRPERRDSDATRSKLTSLPFLSALSTTSSSSKADPIARNKDKRSQDAKAIVEPRSYETKPRRGERRDSMASKATSPSDVSLPKCEPLSTSRPKTNETARSSGRARRRGDEMQEVERPKRSRRLSERNDAQSTTKAESSGLFGSIFRR